MVIIPINHQAIRLLIQIINTCHKAFFEVIVEMLCINDKILILAQEFHRRRICPADGCQISFHFINGIHGNPFVNLCLVVNNLLPEGFINLIKCHAPVCFHNEFLFQPQLFLEILNLCKEINDNLAHTLDGTDFGNIAFRLLFVLGIKVVKVHNLGLDIEIKLTGQKSAQILMDKVIEGILCYIGFQVLLQQIRNILLIALQKNAVELVVILDNPFKNGVIVIFLPLLCYCFTRIFILQVEHKSDNQLIGFFSVFKRFDTGMV